MVWYNIFRSIYLHQVCKQSLSSSLSPFISFYLTLPPATYIHFFSLSLIVIPHPSHFICLCFLINTQTYCFFFYRFVFTSENLVGVALLKIWLFFRSTVYWLSGKCLSLSRFTPLGWFLVFYPGIIKIQFSSLKLLKNTAIKLHQT